MPSVSVILPAKDAKLHIDLAVRSILEQTFEDFELIIVDDGSTDGTTELLQAYSDRRIRLIIHPENLGFAAALNRGIAESRGEFIARMDADDIASRDRIERQLAFLGSNADFGVVASRVRTIGPDGSPCEAGYDPPAGEALPFWALLLFTNPISHPSVVIRRRTLDAVGRFDEKWYPSEDRDLWTRMLPHTRFFVLSERLIDYRVHPSSMSQARRGLQQRQSIAIRTRALAWFLGKDADADSIRPWYDARISSEDARRMEALFREVLHRMREMSRWGADEMAAVEGDMLQRIASVWRRTRAPSRLRRIAGWLLDR